MTRLGNDFMDMTPKSIDRQMKSKRKKKVELHQTKNLYHSKGNSQQSER